MLSAGLRSGGLLELDRKTAMAHAATPLLRPGSVSI